MTELVYVHDFEIISGFIVLACLAILNGNFWAVVWFCNQAIWIALDIENNFNGFKSVVSSAIENMFGMNFYKLLKQYDNYDKC